MSLSFYKPSIEHELSGISGERSSLVILTVDYPVLTIQLYRYK